MDALAVALIVIVVLAVILLNSDRVSRYVGRPMEGILLVGIPLVILGSVGLSFIIDGVREAMLARASEGWPTAPGVVTRSRYDAGDTVRPRGLLLEYDFTVSGQPYRGTRVHFGHSGPFVVLNEAYVVQDRYPEGSAVTVYYNPRDPYNSVLEPGFRPNQWISVIIGLTVLTVAVALGAAGVWASRRGHI